MDQALEAGRANTVMGTMGSLLDREASRDRQEVYLPRIESSILQTVSGNTTTTIGVSERAAPNLTPEQRARLSIEIQPGSLIDANGDAVASGQVGISTVPPELVREMLPPGVLQHTFDITVQAPGITNFTTPAAMTFPNVFNAAPGTQLNFLSFDHTTGRLVIEGTATVSADGLSVTTDPGSGITHPGWHGVTPPGSPSGPEPPAALPAVSNLVVPVLDGVNDYLFYNESRGTMVFKNSAPPPVGGAAGSYMQVTIKVDPQISQKYLDGLRSQQFNLRAGEKKVVQFSFKRQDIKKLTSDMLIGASYTVEVRRVDPGSTSPLVDPKTYYVYRYVDAMDSDSGDAKLEFADTFNDGSGGVTRDRFVPYVGDPAAQPTVNVDAAGQLDFHGFSTPGQVQITFDPLRTQDGIGAAIRVLTPSPNSREVHAPGALQAIGNGVGATVIYLNRAEFLKAMHDLAHDASPVSIVLEYKVSLLDSVPPKFFQISLPDEASPSRTIALALAASKEEVQAALAALPSVGADGVSVTFERVVIGTGASQKFKDTYTITPQNAFADRTTPSFEVFDPNFGGAFTWKVTRQARDGALTQDQMNFLREPGKIEFMYQELVKGLNEKYSALSPAVLFSDLPAPSASSYAFHWAVEVPDGGQTAHFSSNVFDDLIKLLAELGKKGSTLNKNQAAFRIAQILGTGRRDPNGSHAGKMFVQELFNPGEIGHANASTQDLITLLINVVAHETGHGLGLAHVADPNAVSGASEVQRIVVKPGSASFNLTFAGATTANFPAKSSAQHVEDDLLALPGLQGTKIHVTGPNGGPYKIDFDPSASTKDPIFRGIDVPQITGVNVDASTEINEEYGAYVERSVSRRAARPGRSVESDNRHRSRVVPAAHLRATLADVARNALGAERGKACAKHPGRGRSREKARHNHAAARSGPGSAVRSR